MMRLKTFLLLINYELITNRLGVSKYIINFIM